MVGIPQQGVRLAAGLGGEEAAVAGITGSHGVGASLRLRDFSETGVGMSKSTVELHAGIGLAVALARRPHESGYETSEGREEEEDDTGAHMSVI